VSADKGKVVERVVAGSKGGAPKGNQNANKQKQAKTSKTTTETSKPITETSKTTSNNNYNYNYNYNNNINKTLYKPNPFTYGAVVQEYDFQAIENKRTKN
jgi:hypothetical protein